MISSHRNLVELLPCGQLAKLPLVGQHEGAVPRNGQRAGRFGRPSGRWGHRGVKRGRPGLLGRRVAAEELG